MIGVNFREKYFQRLNIKFEMNSLQFFKIIEHIKARPNLFKIFLSSIPATTRTKKTVNCKKFDVHFSTYEKITHNGRVQG